MSKVVRLHTDDAAPVQLRAREDQFRSLRSGLGLQTTWSRMLWYLGAAAAILLGINGLAILYSHVWANGWLGTISTRVLGGEDYNYDDHNWTRPVLEDLAINAALIIGGLAVIGFVRYVSKGAAQWEELEGESESDW
jgi:hypothetical protein